jgi:hypothetical protein
MRMVAKLCGGLLSFASSEVQPIAAATIERELQRVARIGALLPQLRDDSRAASHDTALYVLVLQLKMVELSFARSTVEESLIVCAAPYVPACFTLLALCDPASEDSVPMIALKLLSSVLSDAMVRDSAPMAPFWSAASLCPLIELLLERYFVLRDSELNDWAGRRRSVFPRARPRHVAGDAARTRQGLCARVCTAGRRFAGAGSPTR